MRFRSLPLLLCAALLAAPLPASAWGAQGHRMINAAAIRALPESLPAFMRSTQAYDVIELLGPEADRVKGAGAPLDDDDNPGHYVDAQDDLTVAGVVKLSALPPSRHAYDGALRGAAVPTDQYAQGYLPYEIADGWERIVRDLAYWRVDLVGEQKASTAEDRRFFTLDRSTREALVLRDVGYWGHFVADGSQPLHVSVHFNGWNAQKYPNPQNFSDSRTIHARFETTLVRAVANDDNVARLMPPFAQSRAPILEEVGTYLSASASLVPDVYRLEANGEIDAHTVNARSFVFKRLAAGATEMRNLIVDAWLASADTKVGYPAISVHDVESGTVVPTRATVGFGD
ncbi:MAG TPA: hypothetical protein VGX96_07730 [Candidatus Elarobacter sp.]|jgi:hypothetical protein|nr:hypothetical protein [Candidatus Elarobacter sp.]